MRRWLGILLCSLGLSCSDDPPAGSGSSSGSSGGSTDGTLNELCFNTINDYRKAKGLTPYTRWTASEECSDGQAKSDSQSGKGHGSFGRCEELAQNECPGHPGPGEKAIPGCLELMLNEGPGGGHYNNMMSATYTQVACGAFVTAQGSIWSVQNFR